jgi:caa(3)-type oxidase subunit IV
MSAHLRRLALAWAVLMLLIGATLGLTYLPLGALHMPAALLIAFAMAATLAAVCMRLAKAPSLSFIFAIGGIAWFAVLLVLGETDYRTRPVTVPEATVGAALEHR